MRNILLLILLFGTASIAGPIYKTVDENGKVTFSDSPPDTGTTEEVELGPLNTQEGRPSDDNYRPQNRKTPKPSKQYRIALNGPAQGQQVGPAQRSVTASVSVTPSLDRGYKIQFYFDGQPFRLTSSTSVSIPLPITKRGQRSVSASLLDPQGNIVSRTNSVIIHVIRPPGRR